MSAKLLSARQAANLLGVSKAYICRLFANGVIPAEKVDTDWVVLRKDVQRYIDSQNDVPLYYQECKDWDQADCYFLFRMLDKMLHDRKGRYNDELSTIDSNKLNHLACAILAGLGANNLFPNLEAIVRTPPLNPPVVVSMYPSAGSFPQLERFGVIV